MNAANRDLHTLKIHMATTVVARCVKSLGIWCREQEQSSLVRTLERGKWPMASTLILVATSTAEVAQNAHKAL